MNGRGLGVDLPWGTISTGDLIHWVDLAWSGGGHCGLHHPREVLVFLDLAFSTSGSLPVSVFRSESQIQVLPHTEQILYHSTVSQPGCPSLRNTCLSLEICLSLTTQGIVTPKIIKEKNLEKISAPLYKQDPSGVSSQCWSWTCTHHGEQLQLMVNTETRERNGRRQGSADSSPG